MKTQYDAHRREEKESERGKFAEVKSISKKKSLTEEGKKMNFFKERMQRKIQKVIKKRSNQENFRSRCKQL